MANRTGVQMGSVMFRRLSVILACSVAPTALCAQSVTAPSYFVNPGAPAAGATPAFCGRPSGTTNPFSQFNLIGTTSGSTNPTFPFAAGTVYQSVGAPCATGIPVTIGGLIFFVSLPSNFTALGGVAAGAGGSANELLYGTPHSIQFSAFKQSLNIEDIDVEGAGRFTDEGDADTIGVAYTHFGSNGVEGNRLEGRFEKAWRPFAGSRARAIVDVRGQAVWIGSHVSGAGLVTAAVEVPMKPNWSLTGRIGGGGVLSDSFFGSGGAIYTAAATSRWRAAQLGRGDLVIGNSAIFTGVTTAGGTKNVAFRNGLAYQFPLKGLTFGRQTSMRVSYTNTYVVGDPVPYDLYHEAAVNFGVRLRQNDQKSRFEALRIGLLYTRASHYNAGTLTVGYRF